jgi:ABC-type transport system substrate-binding protein
MELINTTMRKALSYSVNTSYLVNEIMEGECYPWKSPVPEGILYANESFTGAPYYNVTMARKILIDSGIAALHGLDATSSDDNWIDVAEGSDPIMALNFTTHSGLRYMIGEAMKSDYTKIGVSMEMLDKITWDTFVEKMNGRNGHSQNELLISIGAWCPDYNDPINFISPLFKNDSLSNQFQMNDPQVEQWLLDSYTETNAILRQEIFNNIQERIIVDLVPMYNLWQFEDHTIYYNKVIGNYPVNPFGKLYFYPCTFTEPPAPGIPGYELFTLTTVMIGVVAILVFRKKQITA